ncbi:hypothetical protein COY28_06425 [Candidatus Woesearchaeota archaeon CG_4_10_14_0_2_um_filter_57_5]|nr:MAG: hypothetical protein AUJ68_01350 [Candidatus Woesearchaeota archaeon CG1_02_57_44]PIZ49375.1 MAG: hypothetical protein COY28_06425 [Candidatus Woesearchaeota archaeon CG_4_10_14_0_2_um_filter_57_5]
MRIKGQSTMQGTLTSDGRTIPWISTYDGPYACQRCGHSCYATTVPLTKTDRQRLGDDATVMPEKNTGYCPLLQIADKTPTPSPSLTIQRRYSGDASCIGYDRRPLACRQYPFVLSWREDILMVDATYSCPAILLSLGTTESARDAIAAAAEDYSRQVPSSTEKADIPEVAINLDPAWLSDKALGTGPTEMADYLGYHFRQLQAFRKVSLRCIDADTSQFFDIDMTSMPPTQLPKDFLPLDNDAKQWLTSYVNAITKRYCTAALMAPFGLTDYYAGCVAKVWYIAGVVAMRQALDRGHSVVDAQITKRHIMATVFALDSGFIAPRPLERR